MSYTLALLVLGLIGWLAFRGFVNADPQRLAKVLRNTALLLGGVIVVGALATGRFAALLGLLLPAALWWWRQRGLAGVFSTPAGGGRAAPGQSDVRTGWLHMRLDHDSGRMGGVVLQGRFAGRELDALDEAALLELRLACLGDGDSRNLLESYLDRRLGVGWRGRTTEADQGPAGGAAAAGPMTRQDAYAVLGLGAGASEEEIRAAHRRLMSQLHPDRGGSDWLAAQINRARDVLLGA